MGDRATGSIKLFLFMVSIRAEALCVSRNGQPLFHDFSFDTSEYHRIAIMGSTGAGKTTFLNMLAGFVQPDSGKIFVGNDRVMGPNEQLIPGHPWIGYLSQHYELRNNYFVKELLDMANKLSVDRMQEIIQLCNIQHLLDRRTDALSGGERQRIALARVLLADPKWLLLDEPYSNLDLNQKRIIMQLIDDIGEKLGIRLIMVSHDAADMLSWADHLIIIDQGKIVQQGVPKVLYDRPLNEHVAGLLGEYNLCDAVIVQQLMNTSLNLTPGKKIIIRPEHIFISIDEKGIKAVIDDIKFKGSYSLLHCRINNHEGSILVSLSSFRHVKLGEALNLTTLLKYIVVVD
jgi:ABC-type sugar transport system ATPase subunit